MSESDADRLFDVDPTGMWRLFTDVQRLGFETAASVARRFGKMVEEDIDPRWRASGWGGIPAADHSGEPSDAPPVEERLAATAQAAVSAYADLMQASWDAFTAMVDLSMQMGRPWMPGGGGDRLELSIAQGERGSGMVYVHNTAGSAATQVSVSTDGLIGPGGDLIKPGSIALDPDTIEAIPAAGRVEVGVGVAVPKKASPGRYIGVVRAGTTPPIEIVVAVDVTTAGD